VQEIKSSKLVRSFAGEAQAVAKASKVGQAALGGLLRRKEGWSLSFIGKAAAFLSLCLIGFICLHVLYPFLAVNNRIPSNVLVVDGWMPTYDLERAAIEFKQGHYQLVLAVRGVYEFDSSELDRPREDYVAGILIRYGIPKNSLKTVLFPGSKRDRTFASALAIKEWFQQRRLSLSDLDLLTVGTHARRSRLLYQMALGDEVNVGIIGLDDPAYDASHWWRSSEGMCAVLSEVVAYLYVRFLFSPPNPATLHMLGSLS
jgi:hypothetical protein